MTKPATEKDVKIEVIDNLNDVVDDIEGTPDPADSPEGDPTGDHDGDPEGDPDDESEGVPNANPDFNDDDQAFLRLMKNPAYRGILIRSLAEAEGLLNPTPTKTEKVEKRTLAEEVRAIMGDDMDLVPNTLWKAIETILDRKEEGIRATLAESEKSRATREFDSSLQWLNKKYPDAAALSGEMSALAQKYPPAPGVAPREYLVDLYTLAKSRKSSVKEGTVQKKLRRSFNDRAVNGSGGRTSNRMPSSIAEAVRIAQRRLDKQE